MAPIDVRAPGRAIKRRPNSSSWFRIWLYPPSLAPPLRPREESGVGIREDINCQGALNEHGLNFPLYDYGDRSNNTDAHRQAGIHQADRKMDLSRTSAFCLINHLRNWVAATSFFLDRATCS
jgi:hypothetical protein